MDNNKRPQGEGFEEGSEAQNNQDKIEKIEKERQEYLDGWKRAKADLANFRKEEMQRLQDIVKFGSEEIIYELLFVLDSFDLALSSMKENDPSHKGVLMIKAQLEDVLKRRGLTRFSAKVGEQFNPEEQEVVQEVQSDKEKGTVLEELGAGYRLHEKLIRPARVTVAK